ncbi:unnamed protein product [Closterium sp. Yama58-4]|nr:unnamed protein product [Closterium sp. Yama58-4]
MLCSGMRLGEIVSDLRRGATLFLHCAIFNATFALVLVVAAKPELANCSHAGLPFVRRIDAIPLSNFGRPGLSHATIAGHVHHGTQEVEVWMQTFAPGSGTPIHRHGCEELFVVLNGTGKLLFAPDVPDLDAQGTMQAPEREKEQSIPGFPVSRPIGANMTFMVPSNQVHQILNSSPECGSESCNLLQLLVIISEPPIHVYAYNSWDLPHRQAVLKFPYPWDQVCPDAIPQYSVLR